MRNRIPFLFLMITQTGFSAESMIQMPIAKETSQRVIREGENFSETRGFGSEAAVTRSMNLMMIESGPIQVTEVGAQKKSELEIHASTQPDPPTIGKTRVAFSARPGLKFQAQVFSLDMDMGTERPPVRELSPGKYEVFANFTMEGEWGVRLRTSDSETLLKFGAQKLAP